MATAKKASPTTKDVGLLYKLYRDGELDLRPEYQRDSVWPLQAKAYLVDTVLNEKPIPLIFMMRARSAQSGKGVYQVIDGQQRLRAIFDFLDDKLSLTETKGSNKGKKFSELPRDMQNAILNYDLVVSELSGYSEDDIRDIFVRMNKYVVKLAPQERRDAEFKGKFAGFVKELAALNFWKKHRVFTPLQARRKRPAELSAELAILLIEGPQDKKQSVDLYYGKYADAFPSGPKTRSRLLSILGWIESAVPDLASTRYRKPVDLYSLIGALDEMHTSSSPTQRDLAKYGAALLAFEAETKKKSPSVEAARYLVASTSQTDNLQPRLTRISVMKAVLAPQ